MPSRFRRLSGVGVLSLLHWLSTGVLGCLAVVSKLRRGGSWIPGKERAERVLASAISIGGRKRVDVQILFGIECVDEVALQALLQ